MQIQVPYEELGAGDGGSGVGGKCSAGPTIKATAAAATAAELVASGSEERTTKQTEQTEKTEQTEQTEKTGLLCAASTDAAFVARWGQATFDAKYGAHGLDTIWGFGEDHGGGGSSGHGTAAIKGEGRGSPGEGILPALDILPCAVYLRHCVLAVSKVRRTPRNSHAPLSRAT